MLSVAGCAEDLNGSVVERADGLFGFSSEAAGGPTGAWQITKLYTPSRTYQEQLPLSRPSTVRRGVDLAGRADWVWRSLLGGTGSVMDVAAQIAVLSLASSQSDLPGVELLPSRLMRAAAQVLPVAAAGMSFFSSVDHRVPLGASDDAAVLAERLQFTVGEGPCLSAHLEDRVVWATADIMARRWPIFHNELVSKTPYQAIVSLPIDSDEFGAAAAVDLYYTEPRPLISDVEMEEIGLATDIIGALLVANSGLVQTPAAEPVWLNTDAVRARSQVWIAIGMLNVALNLGPVDALATLRSYAYSRDTTIDEIARKINDRQLPTAALTE